MHTVMVIGGAGYVGSALVPTLLDTHKVVVVDTFWFGDYLNEHPNLTKITKNAIDLTKNDFNGIDTVVYLAGLSNDPMSELLPDKCYIYNTAMPLHCAMLAKSVGVFRFVFASSCSVYGYSPDTLKKPGDAIHCDYPYGISKYAAEQGLLAMADDYFNVVALRKGTISGYSPRMRFDLLINTMYKNIVCSGGIKVNNPSLCRPMLSMRDAVVAYTKAIDMGNLRSGIYNVISFNTTLGEVGRTIQQYWKDTFDKDIHMSITFVGDMRNYKANFSAPFVWDYTDNVDNILQDILEHEDTYGNLADPKYSNDLMFKDLVGRGLV